MDYGLWSVNYELWSIWTLDYLDCALWTVDYMDCGLWTVDYYGLSPSFIMSEPGEYNLRISGQLKFSTSWKGMPL